MSAEESSSSTPFLGTMAGVPTYLPGLHGQLTYARTYVPLTKIPFTDQYGSREWVDPREKIRRICFFCSDDYKTHGLAYSYTPSRLRDGRPFGSIPSSEYQGGGYFLVVKTFEDDDQRRFINCMEYAIRIFETRIKDQYGESINDVEYPGQAFHFNQLVQKYFVPIPPPEVPQDGDLAVYENPLGALTADGTRIEGTVHAGIYRATQRNWNSSEGGSIESKWGWMRCHYVYEHEVFWTLDYYGDTVKFYRFREKV
jgi:hypothetical protein